MSDVYHEIKVGYRAAKKINSINDTTVMFANLLLCRRKLLSSLSFTEKICFLYSFHTCDLFKDN